MSTTSPEQPESVGRSLGAAQDPESDHRGTKEEGDVVLHVPELKVDEVDIEVGNLTAHLSLNARIAGLLRLEAGVDVEIDDVKINIKGVEAQTHLRVYLEEVARIIERTFQSIEQTPDLYREVLTRSVSQVEDVTGGASGESGGLLSRITPGGSGDSDAED